MRTAEEIKADLEEAQKELEEATQEYRLFVKTATTTSGDKPRMLSIKEIRPVHDKLAKARILVRALQKELRRTEKASAPHDDE
jgi:hypothetical protein